MNNKHLNVGIRYMVCIILFLYSCKIQLTYISVSWEAGSSCYSYPDRSLTHTFFLYSQLYLSAAVTHSSTESTASLLEE